MQQRGVKGDLYFILIHEKSDKFCRKPNIISIKHNSIQHLLLGSVMLELKLQELSEILVKDNLYKLILAN